VPRPRLYEERRVSTAARIPEDIHRRLRAAAEERDVSVNLLITRALDEYLARLQPVEEALRTVAVNRGA
jgi:predicted transcriptional regulator